MVRESDQVNRSTNLSDQEPRSASPGIANEPKNSDEAQRELERTRSRMSETIGALEQKLEPRRLVDQVIGAIKSAGVESRAVETVRDYPLPFGLIAAGVAWLTIDIIRKQRSSGYETPTPSEGQSTLSGIRQSVSDKLKAGKGKVSELASGVSESVSDAARSVGDKASEMMGGVKERVSGAKERVSSMTSRLRSEGGEPIRGFWNTFQDHPVAMAAGFTAAGVLAGLLVPTSRREEEWIGPTADRLVQNARDSGRRAVQETSEKVGNVARAAADAATERMHGDEPLLEKVKGMAKDAADTAKQQMRKEGFMQEDEYHELPQESGSIGEAPTKPLDTLDYPVEGAAGPNVPESKAFADRPSDAMANRSKSTPQQPKDQIGEFTTDRPEGGSTRRDDKDKGKHKK